MNKLEPTCGGGVDQVGANVWWGGGPCALRKELTEGVFVCKFVFMVVGHVSANLYLSAMAAADVTWLDCQDRWKNKKTRQCFVPAESLNTVK